MPIAAASNAVTSSGGLSEHEARVTGAARYVGDLPLEDPLALAVVRSPLAHGRLTEIDARAACRRPGVAAVLSAGDLDEVPEIPIRVVPKPGMDARLQPVLAVERVRYVGEPVAVVVAETLETARDAAEDVLCRIDPLRAVVDARDPRPEPLWDRAMTNIVCEVQTGTGDVDAAFAEADLVIELELSTQRRTGLPLEPRGLVAEWRADELHLWGVTKLVHFTRRTLAAFFKIEPGRVVCHRTEVGGMFGVRGELYPEDFLVAWAARVTGRPVSWIEDRRDHLLAINHAGEQHHRLAVAVAEDGELLAFRCDALLDMGAYPRPIGGRVAEIVAETLAGPYRWRAFRARCTGVATTKTPIGTVRGPAAFETTFVRERALDVVAERLGIDPLALRRRNLIRHEEMPFRQPMGDEVHDVVYDTGDYHGLVDDLLERCRYAELLAERERRRAAGELVGLGWGFFALHSGVGGSESVTLELTVDGRFVLGTSASEVGQGLDAMAREVAARTLGVDAEDVQVHSGDSRAHGEGRGTYASRSTIFVGSAATIAARSLIEEARRRAAGMLDADADEVRPGRDGLHARGEVLAWKEVAPIVMEGMHEMEEPTYGFGVHLALVSVDAETGGIAVERIVVGYDCGRAIDRRSVQEQLRGATVMGLAAALYEELPYDEGGRPRAPTLVQYLVPGAPEIPPIEVHVFETEPATGNPLGVKGAGEAGVIGVGAAVANAVADALDADAAIARLPVTPADVWRSRARAPEKRRAG